MDSRSTYRGVGVHTEEARDLCSNQTASGNYRRPIWTEVTTAQQHSV